MAASKAALAAHIKPDEWKADPDCPEQNLLSFKKYCKKFQRWVNLTGMSGEREDYIWDLFCMTGGEQLEDLLTQQAKVNMVHLLCRLVLLLRGSRLNSYCADWTAAARLSIASYSPAVQTWAAAVRFSTVSYCTCVRCLVHCHVLVLNSARPGLSHCPSLV